ncbi:MAG: LCP family protein [Candidatus Gracilibacteria bacterium]|nr:LCP family protein [Candidatus Gracilibacteria bacterium]
MAFKKNNLKKSALIPNLIGVTALCIVIFIGYYFIKDTSIFNFNIDKNNTLTKSGVIDKKQNIPDNNTNSEINILVLGRGGGSHEAPNLTDTIILASINLKTRIVSMLSIPRDIYTEYPEGLRDGKINGLYASVTHKYDSKKEGIKAIQEKITLMTGEEIDYYINVDFDGFKKIIDTIGGVEITIPENFVDYRYPDGNWGYKTLVFKEGTWIFDGENALKYARSRHSTSDFDRSIRQQQVIKAIKEKLNGSYFLTSPGKVKELYDVFINHVETNLTLPNILKLAYNLNGKGDYKIISSNLNDTCFYGSATCTKGGFLYSPSRDMFGGMSVLLVEGTDVSDLNNFEKLKKYTDIVLNYPKVYDENYQINIFNGVKVRNLASQLSNDIIKYGFNIPEKDSIGNADKIYEKSIIYYNNIDENSDTLKILNKFFDGKIIKTETPMFSETDAKIEIVIGEDYNTNVNPFKF